MSETTMLVQAAGAIRILDTEAIEDLTNACGWAAEANGWHDDQPKPLDHATQGQWLEALTNWRTTKLMLMVTELAEATEELRSGHDVPETYYPNIAGPGPHKPEGVPSELADVVIRVLDFCWTEGIDLGPVIREKLAYNLSRGYKHGRQF